MRGIVQLDVIPKTIVSVRDPKFTSNFWKGLFKGFETNLNFSTTYHPKSDGQIERVNQVIEDILSMYVIDKPFKWEYYVHLLDFSYNNGYQTSLKMIPFEALYGKRCNTPVSWDNPIDRAMVEPELLREMEEKNVENKIEFEGFSTQEENIPSHQQAGQCHYSAPT
jgi:hypothetical protein